MSSKSELLAAFDAMWSDKWESFEYVLAGIGQEEAAFQHPIYSDEPQQADEPEAGTIHWHVAHLSSCYRHYRALLEARPNNPNDNEAPAKSSFAEEVIELKFTRDKLRNAFAAVPEDGLLDPVFNRNDVASFCRMIVRHDSWHAGQIALAKRL